MSQDSVKQENLPEKKWPYFGPFEVVIHNTPQDCWVSFLGKVYDITKLLKKHENEPIVAPLIAMAGKDISHWFDENTGDIQTYIHPISGRRVPYCPHGRLPDIAQQVPSTDWRPLDHTPWWKDDDAYQIGLLTKRVRPLRIINTLILKETTINVCCEDTFNEISKRYSIFNKDTDSYCWVWNGKEVDMKKTLDENGIFDERDHFAEMGIPQNYYIPSILLYYLDDVKNVDEDEDEDDEDYHLYVDSRCLPLPPHTGHYNALTDRIQ